MQGDLPVKTAEKQSEQSERRLRLVTFSLGEEHYALDITSVREVVKVQKTTRVPGTCDFVLGVTNLRGEILSLVDFRKLMRFEEKPIGEETRIIVVNNKDSETTLGILVDDVTEIIEFCESDLEQPPATLEPGQAQFIGGVARVGDRLVAIVDPNSLFCVQPTID